MKKTRHRKIVEIIEKRDVETQEELAGYLKEAHRWRQTEIRHFKTG